MKRVILSLSTLVALVGFVPAFAVDGVVLIDQNHALAGNITPGDAPGFPVTISQPGSYRFRESTKSGMKWLTISVGAIVLICPLQSVAQSKLTPNADIGTAPKTKTVRIWDACDPVSFDAAVKPGTCLPGHHGQTNFLDFFNELQLDGIAGGWRFNPLLNTTADTFKLVRLELEPGDRISLQNVGGETHTFTKVEKFGGGFFAPLNPLTGNPKPAPECAQVLPDGSLAPQPETDANQFVEAGETELGPVAGTSLLPQGVTHWQCCIHPWMRLNVAVHDHGHEHDQEQENEHAHQQ